MFTIQHTNTGIDKKVHTYDILLARRQTELDIHPNWF